MRSTSYFLIGLLACLIPMSAQADDTRSINFVIFQKSTPSYEYDPIMFGSFSQFVKAMHGSQLLLLTHSSSSRNGDVLNLQQDVLREQHDGHMSDVGINCQLSFHYSPTAAGDTEYTLGGSCQIMQTHSSSGHGEVLQAKIPTTDLPDMVQGDDVWIEVYEDAKSGVAFYANVSQH